MDYCSKRETLQMCWADRFKSKSWLWC